MTGAFVVRGAPRVVYQSSKKGGSDPAAWPPRFAKLTLGFDGGAAAVYADSRRLGKVRLVDDPAAVLPKGRDVLTDPPSPAELGHLLGGMRQPVKAALMDQAILAGVGNWVADEVLYQARVHPAAPAGGLGEAALGRLAAALPAVAKTAVDAGADESRFPEDFIFHVRWDERAGNSLLGRRVAWTKVGGRTTAYVPDLQKLAGDGGGGGKGGSGDAPAPEPKPGAGKGGDGDALAPKPKRPAPKQAAPATAPAPKRAKAPSPKKAKPAAKPRAASGRGPKAALRGP